MSAINMPGFSVGVAAGMHDYHVPGRSKDMGVAYQAEHGLKALYASKYGVQGGYFAAILNDALKAAQLLTAIAYYLLGAAQIMRGSLALYWAAKRSQFHAKVRKGIDLRDNADAKAAYVWGVFQEHMSVKKSKIDKDLAKFEKEYAAKGVTAKQEALIADYQGELDSWSDYISDVGYRFQSWMLGLFGKEVRGENLVQKRHAQIRQEIQFIQSQMQSLSLRGADTEEMSSQLKTFKRARLEDVAQRANLKALGYLISPEFAQELYHNRNTIDMNLASHRATLLDAYLKAESNYHATKVAEIVEGVAYIVIGVVSIALVATVKAAWLRIFLGVLGALMYTRTALQGIDVIRYLMGVETRETFAEEVHKLFNTFKSEKTYEIDLYDEIYENYG